MGGWRLEIGRMAMYITFPVALFHYFNQPELFEEWVVKTKRELYPPEDKSSKLLLDEGIKKIKEKQERMRLQALDQSENNSVQN